MCYHTEIFGSKEIFFFAAMMKKAKTKKKAEPNLFFFYIVLPILYNEMWKKRKEIVGCPCLACSIVVDSRLILMRNG
ncbi:hypothetical protein DERF_004989 [Dermatophagoides farinae]|uniref:Uncharacterized protein n=1 Tax=Dermatophagoides farinae TaxID=6954 RepID=A0A922L5R8_DERFA|nr:hypothetical protein DERF_004989 [Dermatophagoides farinae]